MGSAIRTYDLCRNFGSVTAVRNLNLDIQRGELFGLLGPNGSGKTTIIKMLTGLLPPSAGTIEIMEGRYTPVHREYRQKLGAAFSGSLYERLSATENLRFFSSLFREEDVYAPEEVLRMVDLEDTGKKPVRHFSRGMRQRLELARALINKPRFLFLDEPSLGLDPLGAKKLRQVIRRISSEEVTIFLTTHYMEEAQQLCHRVGFLNNGELVAVDTPHNLKKLYGRNEWHVTAEDGGRLREFVLPRNDEGRIVELLHQGELCSLRLGDATLEDLYIRLTGRGLE